MGVEPLASLALKTLDEGCALGGDEIFDLGFCERYPTDLSKDAEVAVLAFAFGDFGEDSYRLFSTHRTAISR